GAGNLRGARAATRGGGSGTWCRRRARLRVEADGSDLPRAARLDGDRAAPRLGAAVPSIPEPASGGGADRALPASRRRGARLAEPHRARCGLPELAVSGVAARIS